MAARDALVKNSFWRPHLFEGAKLAAAIGEGPSGADAVFPADNILQSPDASPAHLVGQLQAITCRVSEKAAVVL